MDMLETGFWTYFSYFCSQLFQNHILIEATRHTLTFLKALCMSGPEILKKMAYNTFFAVNVCLAILGLLGMFQSLYSVINFLLGLIKINPCLITSYETIKHLFLIFWVLLQQLICHLHPRTFLLIGEQMVDPASTYLRNVKNFLQNEVGRG